MNFIKKTFSLATCIVAFAFSGLAQINNWTTTTLTASVNGCTAGVPAPTCQTTIPLASLTNVYPLSNPVANADIDQPNGTSFTILYVGDEEMAVFQTNTTAVTASVSRGYNGTKATAHNSGDTVYVGPENYFGETNQVGACTASVLKILPYIQTNTGDFFQCYNSPNGQQWFKVGNGSQISGGLPVAQWCSGTVGSAETEYLNAAVCTGATTLKARQVIVKAGAIVNLQVYSSAGVVGGSSKDVATVYKNGSATALTCTIAASGTSCSDTTHSVAVAVGDVIAFQFVTATSDTAANMAMSVLKY